MLCRHSAQRRVTGACGGLVSDGTDPVKRQPWWQTNWLSAWLAVILTAIGVVVSVIAVVRDDDGGARRTAEQTQAVFVYGTMKPGHRLYPEIDQFVSESAPDSVPGTLFDTGHGYPCAVFDKDSDREIKGFVLRLVPGRAAEANAVIAEIENNLYRPVRVETKSGVRATAYEWAGSTDGLTAIPDGNWDRALER